MKRLVASLVVLAVCACVCYADVWFADVTEQMGVSGSAAACWVDYDSDGWVDLYIGGSLFHNEQGQRFTQANSTSGLNANGGGVWGDYDNDGKPDLFTWAEGGALWHNEGDGTFKQVEFPTVPTPVSRSAVWVDIDGDRYLDLYVGGYERWNDEAFYSDIIYLNRRGSFEQYWMQPDAEKWTARGLTTADFDEDGDVDIYVSNYRLQPNLLWRNEGSAQLTDVAVDLGVAGVPKDIVTYVEGRKYPSHGHTIGSAWGDLDNDGHLDLFVGNFSHPPNYQDRPKFLRNRGRVHDFSFADESRLAKLRWQESYASSTLGDCDNDGDLDLYFTTVYKGDHSVLYRNDGNWRFADATPLTGIDAAMTYQAAWADFDNDGDLDLMTGGKLYENRVAEGHWLKVRLEGVASSIGAQARIQLGHKTLTRQVESAVGEANQNDMTLHFGLGDNAGPVEVQIVWPGGATKTVRTPVDMLISVSAP